MPITVSFRGICLFVVSNPDDHLQEILLPRATPDVTPDDGTVDDGLPRFADGTIARPHWTGIVVVDADRQPVFIERGVPGTRVTLVDPKGGTCDARKLFADKAPRLRQVVNGANGASVRRRIDAELGDRVSWRIRAEGGEMLGCDPSRYAWEFTDAFNPGHVQHGMNLPIAPTWTPWDTTATIRLDRSSSGRPVEIPLRDGYDAVIYNYDLEAPSYEQLTAAEKVKSGTLLDHDFKWLYQLLVPSDGDWRSWLATGRWEPEDPLRGQFPMPYAPAPATAATSARVRAAEVSTCFGGGWD